MRAKRRPRVDDILNRPRALRTLVRLAAIGEPVTMGQFIDASEYHNEPAADLRDDLERGGLILVEKHVEGRKVTKQISLTALGRRIVEHAKAIDAEYAAGKRGKSRN